MKKPNFIKNKNVCNIFYYHIVLYLKKYLKINCEKPLGLDLKHEKKIVWVRSFFY